MGYRSPGQTEDILLACEVAAVDLTAVAADIASFLVPFDGYIIGGGLQITTTVACDTIAPVMSVDVADYDDATNRTEVWAVTIADGSAAGNTIDWDAYNFGNGYAVTAGQHLIIEHKTAGTDSGAAAGGARGFVILRPAS